MKDAQLMAYTDPAMDYRKIDRQVTLAMRHAGKPCLGQGCDDQSPCKRHARTTALINRVVK